jgi:aspartyl aminopeptidase
MAGTALVRRPGTGRVERILLDSGGPVGMIPTPLEAEPRLTRNEFPILMGRASPGDYIAGLCGCSVEDILSLELRFIESDTPLITRGDHVGSSRMERLVGAFVAIRAFLGGLGNSDNVKILSIWGTDTKTNLVRSSYESDFLTNILARIFRENSLEKAKTTSLNLVVEPIPVLTGDAFSKVKSGSGTVIKTGIKSNMTSDMYGRWMIKTIAAKGNHTIQLLCDLNGKVTDPGMGPKLQERTGIRTVEAGVPISGDFVRDLVLWKDVKSAVDLLRAVIERYGEIRICGPME